MSALENPENQINAQRNQKLVNSSNPNPSKLNIVCKTACTFVSAVELDLMEKLFSIHVHFTLDDPPHSFTSTLR